VREKLPLPSLYFAHERDVFSRNGALLAVSPFLPLLAGEQPTRERVRFRTVGDMTCTGALRSSATTAEEIMAHCKTLIANYKCPRSVDFTAALPLSGAGKILKTKLREPHWEGRQRNVA
jgi:acyl-CoA synthetase (AMP-forming)/AMP-acid ligase II